MTGSGAWVFGYPPVTSKEPQSIDRRTFLIIQTGLGTLLIVLPPLPLRGEGARPASVPASAFSYLSWRQPACEPTRQYPLWLPPTRILIEGAFEIREQIDCLLIVEGQDLEQ